MHGRVDAGDMPRLDAFDEEFGREPVAILRGQRRKTKLRIWAAVLFLLAAGVVVALAYGWPDADLLAQLQSISFSSNKAIGRESADEVDRLRREVAALTKDVRDLTDVQQQAADTIATLRAAERERRTAYWYSEPAGLMFGMTNQAPRPVAAVPPPRPAAPPRPKALRKRDVVTPLSIEADQQQ